MKLTTNFTLEELIASSTATSQGIDNTPNETQIAALTKLAENILQPIRDKINAPIVISSGFRSEELNTAVNGESNSQHMKGEAADISTSKMSAPELFDIIIRMDIPYDQVILYPTFVHVSHKSSGDQRKQWFYSKGMI